ncbi:MAG TPA: DUF3443 family protein [Steroidobacteraceae bacterium]|jgi:hypothetical protein|nr:DUF3443 family protein [Steroidobacteraceae bacterium]
MQQVHRLSGLLGLLVILALSGCGGGGSVNSSTPTQDSFTGGGSNVVSMTVEPGPADQGDQPFNQPLVTVKICVPGGACGTISGILVDTGSYGLRVMASVLAQAGVTLPAMPDTIVPGNTIQECLPFADGYAWGQVSSATVSIGGETSTGSVPIQVINDASSPSPAIPSSCSSMGVSLNNVDALGANGVLGVGVFVSDCGSYCATTPAASYDIYYSCPPAGGSTCTLANQAVADQVSNPVAYFPTDNNGVILQLPSISSTGASTANGYLVFGIGTETNNGLGGAKVLTADAEGNFTTSFNGSSLGSSFIDSGSNALFFNDSSLALCGNSAPDNEFYCPTSTASLSATNQGVSGTTDPADFSIANLFDISGMNFAINDTGGPAPTIPNFGPYFDWGVPFFYGRTIYFALDGAPAGGTTGPYYAY